jgi:hypothetical protein
MTDRTAAALASALPAGIDYTGPYGKQYSRDDIAGFLLRELESLGWRLVHKEDRAYAERLRGAFSFIINPQQTFAEHTAEALALARMATDDGERHDLDDVIAEFGINPDQLHDHVEAGDE